MPARLRPGRKDLLGILEDKMLVGDGCWEWTGAKSGGGYGLVTTGGKSRVAHRVVYELLVGPIPDGMQLDHLCRHPGCVNPGHLEPVTPQENMARIPWEPVTECLRGHPYNEANEYVAPNGHRKCRACKNAARRRQYHERKNN